MRSRGSSLTFCLSLLLGAVGAVYSAASAHAAGPYITDIEAVGMGQAGAFIASPSTLSAFWYNPAALAGQGGLRLQVEAGLHITPMSYQRAQDPVTGRNYPGVNNLSPLKPAAFAAVTYDFGIEGLAIGAAVYSPTAGNYQYSETGPQRYQSIGADNSAFHIHLGVAYRVFRWLSLGVTFGNTYFRTEQKVAVSGSPGDPEAIDFSVPFTISVSDPFTITSNFGVRFEPVKELSLGLSVMPPYDVNATGTAAVKLPSALSQVEITGDKVSLNVSFPMILRAGIRYRPIERLGIEAAFVWEQWSRNKTIELVPDNIVVNFPGVIDNQQLPSFPLDKRNRDAFSARLGVEGRPFDWLTVRGGAWYESPATRPERFDMTVPDAPKFGLAIGASFNVWKLAFDAAYVHVFALPVEVTASEAVALSVFPNSTPATVGNGRYEYRIDMFHLGIRAAFFDEPKPPPVREPASEVVMPASESASEPAAPAPSSDATAPSTMPSP